MLVVDVQKQSFLWGGYESFKSVICWRYLEGYLNVKFGDKAVKQNYLKEKISIFVAHEYIKENSLYVQYDKLKAINIVQKNCDEAQLERLEKAIKKGKKCSQGLLDDEVLKTLKHMVHVLQDDKSNGKSYAQKLSDMLKQLREELKNSKMTIQQSSELSSILKSLADAKFDKKKDFSQLQHLCCFLEEQVSNEQEKVLSLLEKLQEELTNILKEMRSGSSASYCKVFSSLSSSNTGYMLPKSSNESPQAHSTPLGLKGNMHQFFRDKFLGINTTLSSREQLLCAEQELEKSQVKSMESEDLEGSFYLGMAALNVANKGLSGSRRTSFFVHSNPDDDVMGASLNVGVKLAKEGRLKDADSIFDDVFNKRESGGYSSYSKLKVLHNKAELYRTQGKDEECLKVYKIIYDKLGCDNPASLSVVRDIAGVFFKQGKFDDALRPLQEVYGAQEKILGGDHPGVISVFADIQEVLKAQKSECSTQLFQGREKGKSSYSSSSNTSGFASNFTALSGVQNISEGDKVTDSGSNPSSASGGVRQKQGSYSSRQNVPKSKKEWSNDVKPKKTVHSSKREVGATGSIPSLNKHTSKEQERREKNKVNSCGRGRGK